MRGKEAKRLRKLTGFHPYWPREYRQLGNRIRSTKDGEIKRFPGTITVPGARELYQDMKKAGRHG